MENKEIYVEELWIICVNTLPSKCGSTNPYSLNTAWVQWIPSEEYNMKKKEGGSIYNGEIGQTLLQTGHQG